jgi:hypothetical protein
MNSNDVMHADQTDPRQQLEDDVVLIGLGEAAFAAALAHGRQWHEEFAPRAAAAVRATMPAEKVQRP